MQGYKTLGRLPPLEKYIILYLKKKEQCFHDECTESQAHLGLCLII